ncbi:hypothetical protein D3C73_909740 [compost metagenome]
MLHLDGQLPFAKILRKDRIDNAGGFGQFPGAQSAHQPLLRIQRIVVGRVLDSSLMIPCDAFLVHIHGVFQRLLRLLKGPADLCNRSEKAPEPGLNRNPVFLQDQLRQVLHNVCNRHFLVRRRFPGAGEKQADHFVRAHVGHGERSGQRSERLLHQQPGGVQLIENLHAVHAGITVDLDDPGIAGSLIQPDVRLGGSRDNFLPRLKFPGGQPLDKSIPDQGKLAVKLAFQKLVLGNHIGNIPAQEVELTLLRRLFLAELLLHHTEHPVDRSAVPVSKHKSGEQSEEQRASGDQPGHVFDSVGILQQNAAGNARLVHPAIRI